MAKAPRARSRLSSVFADVNFLNELRNFGIYDKQGAHGETVSAERDLPAVKQVVERSANYCARRTLDGIAFASREGHKELLHAFGFCNHRVTSRGKLGGTRPCHRRRAATESVLAVASANSGVAVRGVFVLAARTRPACLNPTPCVLPKSIDRCPLTKYQPSGRLAP